MSEAKYNMMIDTHSHIYDEQFDEDRDETVSRALEAGVGKILLPATESLTKRCLPCPVAIGSCVGR